MDQAGVGAAGEGATVLMGRSSQALVARIPGGDPQGEETRCEGPSGAKCEGRQGGGTHAQVTARTAGPRGDSRRVSRVLRQARELRGLAGEEVVAGKVSTSSGFPSVNFRLLGFKSCSLTGSELS